MKTKNLALPAVTISPKIGKHYRRNSAEYLFALTMIAVVVIIGGGLVFALVDSDKATKAQRANEKTVAAQHLYQDGEKITCNAPTTDKDSNGYSLGSFWVDCAVTAKVDETHYTVANKDPKTGKDTTNALVVTDMRPKQ